MKRQLMEREKIFANDVTNKDLISKIYKHLYTSITKKPNNNKKKTQSMSRRSKQTFYHRTYIDDHQAQEKILHVANY